MMSQSRFDISNIFHLYNFENFAFFSKQTLHDLEENLAKIHLSDWQFFLPWAIGQWDN